ncbi:uncharacterized protein LOC114976683 [Acropora millepora]|uniref:uncharacterized protein LOC114976683 n=1 Tax=Acropora millepora TaxID=45264 RepID=UPI001CF329EC|nr:uncharacterized protein LOC114976683 [Acropora millepora]
MPAKRKKPKILFRVFSSHNYSRVASRFPFLKGPQIKAKLLQAWRNELDSKNQTMDPEHVPVYASREIPGQAERKIEARSRGINTGCEENRANLSPLRTYSEATYRRKRRLQDSQTSISQSPQSSQTSTAASEGNSPSKIGAKSEIIDLLEEISAEQLLIEPDEMCSAEDLDSLNHEPWLVEQSQNVQENENTVNTVSEMFQWRTADPVTQLSPNRNEEMDENRRQSRFLISSDCEGDSNFMSLFDEKDVFL